MFLCLNNQQAMGRYTVLSESPIGDFCWQISPLNLHFEWIWSEILHLFVVKKQQQKDADRPTHRVKPWVGNAKQT